MTLRVVTAPTETLLSAAELRLYCGLQGVSDWDDLLSGLLTAAVGHLEAATQRRFLTQVLDWSLPAWPARRFQAPVAPVAVNGVTSITYVDTADATQTLSSTLYRVGPCGPTVDLRPLSTETWPLLSPDAAEPLVIRLTAGGAAAAVDGDIKTAAGLLVAHLFEHRDRDAAEILAPSRLPMAVEALIGAARW